jgi:hypothetical protein
MASEAVTSSYTFPASADLDRITRAGMGDYQGSTRHQLSTVTRCWGTRNVLLSSLIKYGDLIRALRVTAYALYKERPSHVASQKRAGNAKSCSSSKKPFTLQFRVGAIVADNGVQSAGSQAARLDPSVSCHKHNMPHILLW